MLHFQAEDPVPERGWICVSSPRIRLALRVASPARSSSKPTRTLSSARAHHRRRSAAACAQGVGRVGDDVGVAGVGLRRTLDAGQRCGAWPGRAGRPPDVRTPVRPRSAGRRSRRAGRPPREPGRGGLVCRTAAAAWPRCWAVDRRAAARRPGSARPRDDHVCRHPTRGTRLTRIARPGRWSRASAIGAVGTARLRPRPCARCTPAMAGI